MVTLSAMRTSYDAADSPNDMPRTTSRSTNGQIMGTGDAHLRRISCAGKITAVEFLMRNRSVAVEMLAPEPAQQRRQHVLGPLAILIEARRQRVALCRRNETKALQVI